jgi:ABC-type transporter Mla maintaining outer membrane lipid asymmetry ATPase subunit MlaF/ABC-type transporter Mla maintaining outer membrane lipid asymmetry permease subunit MlaE
MSDEAEGQASASPAAPALEIRKLHLEAGGRLLLEEASMEVGEGEVVLLVGLSGTGKSLTLRLILDLLDRDDPAFRVSGEIALFGSRDPRVTRERAGIVFQDFGLFDEWSSAENIAFGHDHGRRAAEDRGPVVNRFLEDFDLGAAGRVATLSGGMKQRCALARTLAFDPDLLVFDEPTSGLDPAMSTTIAERIRRTAKDYGKTALVVTHDLDALAGIADRIVLLDPRRRIFREVPSDRVGDALDELRRYDPETVLAPESSAPPRRRLLDGPRSFAVATGRALEAALAAAWALIPRWPRLRWGLRYLVYYLRLAALGSALVYVGLAGFILGLIVTYFTFSFLPFKTYTEPLLIDRIVGAIGYGLFRIMVPGMTVMLVAARSGAAVAADIGNRVYSRQIEAMRSFGVNPARYLLSNALWAHVLGMPLLVLVNWWLARAASLVVFNALHPEQSTWFWAAEFERFLGEDILLSEGGAWVFGKSVLSALGVATIAYFQGMRPKESGRDVATAVTRTIIWATLFVLLVQVISAFLEFDPI